MKNGSCPFRAFSDAPADCQLVVVDLGYSARKRSCGLFWTGTDRPVELMFGDAVRRTAEAVRQFSKPLLVLEGVLSTYHAPSGNPDVRGTFERGRGWYYGAGVLSFASAFHFLQMLNECLKGRGSTLLRRFFPTKTRQRVMPKTRFSSINGSGMPSRSNCNAVSSPPLHWSKAFRACVFSLGSHRRGNPLRLPARPAMVMRMTTPKADRVSRKRTERVSAESLPARVVTVPPQASPPSFFFNRSNGLARQRVTENAGERLCRCTETRGRWDLGEAAEIHKRTKSAL